MVQVTNRYLDLFFRISKNYEERNKRSKQYQKHNYKDVDLKEENDVEMRAIKYITKIIRVKQTFDFAELLHKSELQ